MLCMQCTKGTEGHMKADGKVTGVVTLMGFSKKRLLLLQDFPLAIFLSCVYVCELCVFRARRGQKRALDPLELELQMVVNH